jgi:ubiquinone/menaquinone biosynthesis C-methylase UbiE
MSELKIQYGDWSNLNARIAIYRYGAEGGFGPAQVLDLMLKAIPTHADILEVGCGPGWMWRRALGRVPRSWRILLTDLTPGMTEEVDAALGNEGRFRVRQMDVHTLDLPDASFDAVIANWMLYHVEDRARVLGEIRRVLKPGGALFAATNGDAHVREIDLLVNEYLGDAAPTKGRLAFSLENGEAQLSPFFASIAVHQRRGTLRITETEAIVQYVLSFSESKQMIVGDRLDDLRRRVRGETGATGAFVVQIHSGLFIARKA